MFNKLLQKLGLITMSEHKKILNANTADISLDKMELEKKYNSAMISRAGKIDKLTKDNKRLEGIIYDFPVLLKSYYNPGQVNALYYEMISTVRNTSSMRHLLGIWFKRMINAIDTLDSELMNNILEENKLAYEKQGEET